MSERRLDRSLEAVTTRDEAAVESQALSLDGFKAAGARMGLRVALPFVLLMGTYVALRTLDNPLLGKSIVLATSLLLIAAAWKRSYYLLWAMYLQGLNVFGFLWERVDTAGMPLRFEYALDADRLIGLGQVPTVWLQQHLYTAGSPGVHDWFLMSVYFTFFAGPHLALLVLWQSDRQLARSFVVALLATLFLGLTVIALVPTAPPWMAAQEGLTEPVHRVVREIADGVSQSAYERGEQVAGSNPVAAMPSLHMAVAVVLAITLIRGRRGLVRVAVPYMAAMGLALVYLGEHYVVDVIAGLATGLIGYRAADLLLGVYRADEVVAETEAEAEPQALPKAA